MVNVDVDANRKSNRVEWASAVYRPYFHPLCAFELEIQWEMATGSLLSELLFSYSKMANKYNFHLVPAPIDPFAVPIVANSDPLRRSLYIKLNLSCLLQQESGGSGGSGGGAAAEKVLFESLIDDKYKTINLKDIFALADTTSNSSSSSNTKETTNLTYKYLAENYGEFLEYLHESKDMCKETIEKRLEIEDEAVDFVKQELHEFIESERIRYLQYFQEAILEK